MNINTESLKDWLTANGFKNPVIILCDTPAATPSVVSEQGNEAQYVLPPIVEQGIQTIEAASLNDEFAGWSEEELAILNEATQILQGMKA
jgi:peroxiredoxin